jgi:hypothetical protein
MRGASRVDRHETAFSYRDAKWSMVIVGVDPDPANADKITAWTEDYWAVLHPYSLGGAYVNFMMDEGIDRVKATAPPICVMVRTVCLGHCTAVQEAF